jgi:hypothetical protein
VIPSYTTTQKQRNAPAQALLNEPGPWAAQQLDRRSLLLGVVIGSQLLNIQQTRPAFADDLSDINTVGPGDVMWCGAGGSAISPAKASAKSTGCMRPPETFA